MVAQLIKANDSKEMQAAADYSTTAIVACVCKMYVELYRHVVMMNYISL